MAFTPVCRESELPSSGMLRRDIGGQPVAVYRIGDAFYATAAICTHAEADLTEGRLEGTRVVCPLHGARFDVISGRVLSPPASRPLRTFATRVAGGRVEVDLP